MSTLSTGALTLADWAKRLDPDGKTATIVELLSQTNEILDDMLWVEGNLPTGNRTTVRTGLPTVAWRLLNQGVAPSKSTTTQVDHQAGMLEAWSEVDCDLAKLNGNVNRFRMSESKAFTEAMSQEMAQTLFYGNSGLAMEEFTGLTPYYSAISGATNGSHVISGGGTGSDNSSIWLVVWGDQTVFGLFPKGSKAGLIHQDFGEETVETTAGVGGNRMRAYRERFQWKAGLALRDWRYAVRICNIDISLLVAQSAGTFANLSTLMIKAIYRIPNIRAGKAVFYMNRTCMEMLDIIRRTDVISGGGLDFSVVDGKRINTFRGIPIRIVDQLTEAEATVS
jgi:major capsid protein gp7